MPTPTETLEALVTAYDLLYSAPEFGTVQNGAETGDKYISAPISEGVVLRVDYRVNGTAEYMNNWTVIFPSAGGGDPTVTHFDETGDETDLLGAITAGIDAVAALGAAFVAVE